MPSPIANTTISDNSLLERIDTVQDDLDRTMDSYRDSGRIYHRCSWRARSDNELDPAVRDILHQLYVKADPIEKEPWFHHHRVALREAIEARKILKGPGYDPDNAAKWERILTKAEMALEHA
ncbi:hypothetical protein LTS18_014983 [Coniosporium uncinatum]|uniref:Uncharacterized protein n=1 Tax=Coniosporium uncinatum TaxID=93489 RepID=A0ACC3D8Y7_9PEZI|nr:hypothetical protein LTS18_014983 [Coniosporium uncinatum]